MNMAITRQESSTVFNAAARRIHHAELRRRIAQQVHQCSQWLRVQGYEILRVEGGFCQPRIVIKPSPLCDQLDGAADAFERTRHGACHYRYAVRFGCMVTWTESEAHHGVQ